MVGKFNIVWCTINAIASFKQKNNWFLKNLLNPSQEISPGGVSSLLQLVCLCMCIQVLQLSSFIIMSA